MCFVLIFDITNGIDKALKLVLIYCKNSALLILSSLKSYLDIIKITSTTFTISLILEQIIINLAFS